MCVCVCVFQGVISELKVIGDPRAAELQCDEDGDDSDAVSTSSWLWLPFPNITHETCHRISDMF